jgi:putative sugar O-methyltransferase
LGLISPSTIRYLKNSLDILTHFGKDSQYGSIAEIGAGYGGLCKVFSSFVNFETYTLVDLPEPSKLSKKYLSLFDDLKNKVVYTDTNSLFSFENLDLVISNYAFSECSKPAQIVYYNDIIKKSKRFYIVYNSITENNLSVFDFINLVGNDFTVYVEQESRPNHLNYIIYGTKK